MEGKCYYCQKEVTNKTVKRHVKSCKERKNAIETSIKESGEKKEQFILKIYDKYYTSVYYIYMAIDTELTLDELDNFIRDIWVECCGHLSSFTINGVTYSSYDEEEYGEEDFNIRLSSILDVEDKFTYVYDYGSSTELIIEVVDKFETGSNASSIEILARNNEVTYICKKCGKKATFINYEENEFVCSDCIDDCDEDIINELGYTNSPRDGVCGYIGDKDVEKEYLPYNGTIIESDISCEKTYNSIYENDNDFFYDEDCDYDLDGEALKNLENRLNSIVKKISQVTIKRKSSTDLREILKYETKDNLKTYMDKLNIPYKSSHKKDVLIDNMCCSYKNSIKKVICHFNYDIYETLCEFKDNKGIIIVNNFCEDEVLNFKILRREGIAYASNYNNEFAFCVPKEVLDIISEIDKEVFYKNDEIIKLFKGMLYYYGMVSLDEFIERLPEDIHIDLTKDDLIKVLELGTMASSQYEFKNEIGYSIFLDEDCEVRNFINNDYRKCTSNELFKAAKRVYIGDENNYSEIKKFFKKNYEVDNEDLEEILHHIYVGYQLVGLEEMLNVTMDEYCIDEYEISNYIKIVSHAMRKIPRWKCNGYSEFEKNSQEKSLKEQKLEEIKIGRNDPCPCGSGKKYKKCCGSKIIKIY